MTAAPAAVAGSIGTAGALAAGAVVVAAGAARRLARSAGSGRATARLVSDSSARQPGAPGPRRGLAVVSSALRAADVDVDAGVLTRRWAVVLTVGVVLAAARWGVGGVVVAVGLCVGGPAAFLAWRRGREAQRYAAALPGVLEAVAGKLRAGASLPDAVATSADDRTGSATLDADLAALSRRVSRGQPFTVAVETWADGRSAPGVGLVAAALVLGSEAGGARAKALDGVAATLRDRRALEAEVDALSSQARASAVVMMGAPVVFAALGLLSDPDVATFLLRTPAGLGCLAGGLVLDAVAGLWMLRIAAAAR